MLLDVSQTIPWNSISGKDGGLSGTPLPVPLKLSWLGLQSNLTRFVRNSYPRSPSIPRHVLEDKMSSSLSSMLPERGRRALIQASRREYVDPNSSRGYSLQETSAPQTLETKADELDFVPTSQCPLLEAMRTIDRMSLAYDASSGQALRTSLTAM